MFNHLFSGPAMPFLMSAAVVTLNEMGDKTQLLAMAFATRMKFWKVMLGVLLATVLNHGLAVAVGALLASVPGWQGWVKFIAALLFIGFGLWALKSDRLEEEETRSRRYGDVATVAIAFFLAEMGDKTQFATITLSAQYSATPLLVLAGTTTGMLLADSIGILVGVLLNRKIPAAALKVVTSAVFILFGISGLWESLLATFGLPQKSAAGISVIVALLTFVIGFSIFTKDKSRMEKERREDAQED